MGYHSAFFRNILRDSESDPEKSFDLEKASKIFNSCLPPLNKEIAQSSIFCERSENPEDRNPTRFSNILDILYHSLFNLEISFSNNQKEKSDNFDGHEEDTSAAAAKEFKKILPVAISQRINANFRLTLIEKFKTSFRGTKLMYKLLKKSPERGKEPPIGFKSVTFGYFTMDETKKLIPMPYNDPERYQYPLCGIWVHGLEYSSQTFRDSVYIKQLLWGLLAHFVSNSRFVARLSIQADRFNFFLGLFNKNDKPKFFVVEKMRQPNVGAEQIEILSERLIWPKESQKNEGNVVLDFEKVSLPRNFVDGQNSKVKSERNKNRGKKSKNLIYHENEESKNKIKNTTEAKHESEIENLKKNYLLRPNDLQKQMKVNMELLQKQGVWSGVRYQDPMTRKSYEVQDPNPHSSLRVEKPDSSSNHTNYNISRQINAMSRSNPNKPGLSGYMKAPGTSAFESPLTGFPQGPMNSQKKGFLRRPPDHASFPAMNSKTKALGQQNTLGFDHKTTHPNPESAKTAPLIGEESWRKAKTINSQSVTLGDSAQSTQKHGIDNQEMTTRERYLLSHFEKLMEVTLRNDTYYKNMIEKMQTQIQMLAGCMINIDSNLSKISQAPSTQPDHHSLFPGVSHFENGNVNKGVNFAATGNFQNLHNQGMMGQEKRVFSQTYNFNDTNNKNYNNNQMPMNFGNVNNMDPRFGYSYGPQKDNNLIPTSHISPNNQFNNPKQNLQNQTDPRFCAMGVNTGYDAGQLKQIYGHRTLPNNTQSVRNVNSNMNFLPINKPGEKISNSEKSLKLNDQTSHHRKNDHKTIPKTVKSQQQIDPSKDLNVPNFDFSQKTVSISSKRNSISQLVSPKNMNDNFSQKTSKSNFEKNNQKNRSKNNDSGRVAKEKNMSENTPKSFDILQSNSQQEIKTKNQNNIQAQQPFAGRAFSEIPRPQDQNAVNQTFDFMNETGISLVENFQKMGIGSGINSQIANGQMPHLTMDQFYPRQNSHQSLNFHQHQMAFQGGKMNIQQRGSFIPQHQQQMTMNYPGILNNPQQNQLQFQNNNHNHNNNAGQLQEIKNWEGYNRQRHQNNLMTMTAPNGFAFGKTENHIFSETGQMMGMKTRTPNPYQLENHQQPNSYKKKMEKTVQLMEVDDRTLSLTEEKSKYSGAQSLSMKKKMAMASGSYKESYDDSKSGLNFAQSNKDSNEVQCKIGENTKASQDEKIEEKKFVGDLAIRDNSGKLDSKEIGVDCGNQFLNCNEGMCDQKIESNTKYLQIIEENRRNNEAGQSNPNIRSFQVPRIADKYRKALEDSCSEDDED